MGLIGTGTRASTIGVFTAMLLACGGVDDGTTPDTPTSSSSSSSNSGSPSGSPVVTLHPDAKTFQAEDYLAWYDVGPGNITSLYRQDDVDIVTGGEGFQVGHIETGEWLEYSLTLEQSGEYEAVVYYQAVSQPSLFSILVNGENRALYQTALDSSVMNASLSYLPAGTHRLRIHFSSALAETLAVDKIVINPVEYGSPEPVGIVYPAGLASAGAVAYQAQCSFCHGDQGQGNPAIENTNLIGCATCDNFQGLATHIADTMPQGNPKGCEGACAADIAAFIQEEINKPFDLGSCNGSPQQEVTPDTLKRLSRSEYILTIKDLLAIPDSETFEELPTDARSHNFNTLADKQNISANYMRAYLAIAERQSKAMVADSARREKVIGCDINEPGCYSNFMARLGRLAYRRPLNSIEWWGITNFSQEHAKDTADRFALTAQVFLSSPNFLYRDESGGEWTECAVESGICKVSEWSKIRYGADGFYTYTRSNTDLHCSHTEFGDPAQGRAKKCWTSPVTGPLGLDEYQLASRLSFSLWGRGPNADLLNKARSGALATAEGRRQVIQEMLQDDKSKQHFAEFFTQWLALFRLTTPDDKPEGWYDGVIEDMKAETHALLSEHAWGGKNFLDILTANHTHVNSELAQYYGFGSASGRVEFEKGDPKSHTGILTHGANMFRKTDGDLVSIRGNWLRDTFLCKDIVLPAAAQDAIENEFAGFSTLEIIKARNEQANCKGCHAIIDPIGIVLRSFDGTGLFDYQLDLNTYPVKPGFPDIDHAQIRTAKDLAFHLSMMPEVGQCLTKRMFLYTRFKEPTKEDSCVIDKIASEFEASNFDLETLILSLISDDSFTYRKLPRP